MIVVTLRFYAQLNELLPRDRRGLAFAHPLRGPTAIKDVIESLGVPHTEVDLILVNGEAVGFRYVLQHGDRASIYPAFRTVDITPLPRTGPDAPEEVRFVLDTHLGRLARYLRLLGYDALYRNDYDDPELARVSRSEDRILLTRDRGLLMRTEVVRGHLVRSSNPRHQLREVVLHYGLAAGARPLTRCLRCNGALHPIAKEDVFDRLETLTRIHYHEFVICERCAHVYWLGSHVERMRRLIDEALRGSDGSA
jgi:uncharacterized protein